MVTIQKISTLRKHPFHCKSVPIEHNLYAWRYRLLEKEHTKVKTRIKSMKKIIGFLICTMFSCTLIAQTQLRKVYDESINPMEQIDQAVTQAKLNNKFVLCQVGGNWCIWCLRFANFVTTDSDIAKIIKDNYVYIHVNYSSQVKNNANTLAMLKRLDNPTRFGFPVLVVINADGKVIHIQDSSFLEEGQGYNKNKVVRFLSLWTPKAVNQ